MATDERGPRGIPSVAELRQRIARFDTLLSAALLRSGRQRDTLRVVAATKTLPAVALPAVYEVGLREWGENRWQDARIKLQLPWLASVPERPLWHFIGRLQANKAKYVVPHFDVLHSLDSLALANEVSSQAVRYERCLPCFVQVNVSGENTKAGVDASALLPLVEHLSTLPGLQCIGLMTMAPFDARERETRLIFRHLRELRDDCLGRGHDTVQELSMGMSNDFGIAVEEGATVVRIGRRLVGGTPTLPRDTVGDREWGV